MDTTQLVNSMTPEVYNKLLQAVETGKWLDGSALTEQQKEVSMQAVMLYQSRVLKSDQHMTVGASGDIVHKSRQELKTAFSDQNSEAHSQHQHAGQDNTIARFKQDDF